ncbi:hypothetical protein GCM10009802_09420 [Streptomyces synnematoformans]|uniref:Uncharacterized protein n=1 Tax=Streptomyces synnematoformans TaxID=415721 RepID=A0ABP5J3W6_9ACTN
MHPIFTRAPVLTPGKYPISNIGKQPFVSSTTLNTRPGCLELQRDHEWPPGRSGHRREGGAAWVPGAAQTRVPGTGSAVRRKRPFSHVQVTLRCLSGLLRGTSGEE